MTERTKRLCAVFGSVLSALSIALALLAFVSIGAFAATDTGMPAASDIIPDENGTSVLPLPENGNRSNEEEFIFDARTGERLRGEVDE